MDHDTLLPSFYAQKDPSAVVREALRMARAAQGRTGAPESAADDVTGEEAAEDGEEEEEEEEDKMQGGLAVLRAPPLIAHAAEQLQVVANLLRLCDGDDQMFNVRAPPSTHARCS